MEEMGEVKGYWWRGVSNFGDALAPFLLERFANAKVEWAPAAEAEVVSVGSVLEHIPSNYSGYILGSGKIRESSVINLPDATILALRGPLSAKGIKGDYALGDPGLLADELVGPQDKQWDLGIVPHWKDKELAPRFLELFKKSKAKLRVINPQEDPITVVRQIGACERIVTSSLHGMIVADAFGLPRRVELATALDNHTEGGDFKFRDYSASIHTPFEPGVMVHPIRGHIEDVKFAIYDVYQALEDIVLEPAR